MNTMLIKNKISLLLLVGVASFGQTKKWTLEECVNHAIEHNITIKQSKLDAEVSEVAKKDAFGRFLPTINANASHSWNIGLNTNITTGLLENQTTQFTSAGFSVGIDIYKGLQNQHQLQRARLAVIASQYQTTKMQEDVSLNVVNAFLQILFNKENLKVQQEQLSYDTKQLAKTESLVEAGSLPKGDLLDVKATIEGDKLKVVNAENALLISKVSLAQLLQINDYQNFDIEDSQAEVYQSSVLFQEPKAVFEKAKENRTDLKIAQTNVQLAQKDIKIARGAYQPSLQGVYGFSTRAASTGRVIDVVPNETNPFSTVGVVQGTGQVVIKPNFTPVLGNPEPIFEQFDQNKGQNFGLQLSVPIFNGFATRNNVSRSKIAFEKSKLTLEQAEQNLEKTVFTVYTDTKGAQKSYEAALSTYEARKKSAEYAKERYEVGLMNVFDYNQAQTMFVNAQSEVLRTKYDYIFRTKILEFYFGIPIINKK